MPFLPEVNCMFVGAQFAQMVDVPRNRIIRIKR